MTPKQIELVQHSWPSVQIIEEAAASLFYKRLFELDPSLRVLFKGDMKEQGRKLMRIMSVAVSSLSHITTIVPAVEAMGRRHASYGVQDEHYATVAEALLWTLEQGLGAAFTPEVREAWTSAYLLLAQTMKTGARTIIEPTERAA